MRTIIGGLFGIMVMMMIAIPASAASENASPKACFGQDRAVWISENGGRAWGEIASERKGENAEINHAYKEGCQP